MRTRPRLPRRGFNATIRRLSQANAWAS
jgi:hypothetical protein